MSLRKNPFKDELEYHAEGKFYLTDGREVNHFWPLLKTKEEFENFITQDLCLVFFTSNKTWIEDSGFREFCSLYFIFEATLPMAMVDLSQTELEGIGPTLPLYIKYENGSAVKKVIGVHTVTMLISRFDLAKFRYENVVLPREERE